MQTGRSTISREIYFRKGDPRQGVPSEIHSDRGTHFTGQIVKEICNIGPIMQHFHGAYHTQSFGLMERTTGKIKTHLAKIVDAFSLPWSKSIPLVLLNLRSTVLANIIGFLLRLSRGD